MKFKIILIAVFLFTFTCAKEEKKVSLIKFGYTKLLYFKSTLLKTIPKLGSAGFMQTFTMHPLCKPIPLKDTSLFIVF